MTTIEDFIGLIALSIKATQSPDITIERAKMSMQYSELCRTYDRADIDALITAVANKAMVGLDKMSYDRDRPTIYFNMRDIVKEWAQCGRKYPPGEDFEQIFNSVKFILSCKSTVRFPDYVKAVGNKEDAEAQMAEWLLDLLEEYSKRRPNNGNV